MINIEFSPAPDQTEKRAYPWLGISSGKDHNLVVLFTSSGCGTVLNEDKNLTLDELGDYKENFIMESFKKFKGKITISN
jgi:hypothetical protein